MAQVRGVTHPLPCSTAPMRSTRIGVRGLAAAVVVSVVATVSGPGASVFGPVSAASAASGGPSEPVSCNAWVRDGGVDAAGRGTASAPYATLTFAQGQTTSAARHTICIPGGATLTMVGGGEAITRADTILAGDPASAVKPQIRGRLTVTGHDVTIRGVRVTHSTLYAATVRLWGDHVSLLDSDVTATHGTCVEVGHLSAAQLAVDVDDESLSPHKVSDVVIRGNNIGPCARSDDFLNSWTCNASGLPGIYSQWVEGLDIVGNYIHDTALRGVQLYPKNDLVTVAENMFRDNSIAMNIGTSGEEDDDDTDDDLLARSQHQATRIVVERNVFAEQSSSALAAVYPRLRGPEVPPGGGTCAGNKYLAYNSPPGLTIDDEATLYARMAPVQVTPSVTIRQNCGTDVRHRDDEPVGFTWTDNVLDTPAFVSDVDPHQTAGSPCRGYGPVVLRPGGAAPVVTGVGAPSRTATRRITVTVAASDDQGVTEMRLANEDGVFSAWRPFASSVAWTLSASSSQARSVLVQVRDAGLQESATVSRAVTFLPAHDLSGDALDDLLVRRTSDHVLRLYRGTTAGSLSAPTTSMTGSWAAFDKVIVTRDFDGDGRTDVIARVASGQTGAGQLRLYPGNNAGGFGTPRTVGTGWATFTTIVAPGDFNGDGTSDLLGVKANGTLWLYPGSGSGGFLAPTQIGTSTVFNTYTFYTPGDFSGDGRADVILRRSDGVLLLGLGDGRGSFQGAFAQIGTGWSTLTVVGAGDMNHDSFPDLVARKANGTLWVYRGTGTGGFNGSYQIGASTTWGAFDTLA